MAETKALAGVATASATIPVAGIQITHFLWLDWGRIAQSQLASTREARLRFLQLRDDGGNPSEALGSEHTAALITISACAHALDGVYGEIKPLVAASALAVGASRHQYIRAALGAAFVLANADAKRWKQEFAWLHDLRDAAVHPVAISRPSVPHPVHGNGSYEGARYCLESGERAMALLLDVLSYVASADKAKNGAVQEYGKRMDASLQSLLSFQQ